MSNQEKISQWFHQYSDDVYHFLIYRTGKTDVEDMVQEVFIRAIKGVESFKGSASPKTWLFSIARNLAIDEMKKEKWKRLISFQAFHEPSSLDTPETLYQANEETQTLYKAIQELKASYRDVIILRGIKEFTVDETAEVLQWPPGKVRSTYHRAKAALHKQLGGQ
ncbi:RNA polymerase sigma factor [Bacillus salacetis]|uniref:RNA polymerase sigma factor n=1 Tax=Bacillus salacetis TaxID=2315464 RepID=A0A3A1QQ46_9BACI|nr:RNA polymerase sigma factor [Bacillus salacetis]RIW28617.1 RNA polymerase sigma factor [Bacillus salacetis]